MKYGLLKILMPQAMHRTNWRSRLGQPLGGQNETRLKTQGRGTDLQAMGEGLLYWRQRGVEGV